MRTTHDKRVIRSLARPFVRAVPVVDCWLPGGGTFKHQCKRERKNERANAERRNHNWSRRMQTKVSTHAHKHASTQARKQTQANKSPTVSGWVGDDDNTTTTRWAAETCSLAALFNRAFLADCLTEWGVCLLACLFAWQNEEHLWEVAAGVGASRKRAPSAIVTKCFAVAHSATSPTASSTCTAAPHTSGTIEMTSFSRQNTHLFGDDDDHDHDHDDDDDHHGHDDHDDESVRPVTKRRRTARLRVVTTATNATTASSRPKKQGGVPGRGTLMAALGGGGRRLRRHNNNSSNNQQVSPAKAVQEAVPSLSLIHI